jgi:hypothetical protein
MIGEYFIGLDLGQSQDFTAVAVLERTERKGDWDPVVFAWRKEADLRLRHVERMALGTPYPEVVERVRALTHARELAGRCRLMVDATGVGRPVVDLLRQADLECCRILPVLITGGEAESVSNGYHHVPKRDLISGLQVLLQREQLQIAAGLAYGPALVKEMMEMRVRVTAPGREQYGAWREKDHDDLVFAVALSCWGARKMYPDGREGEVQYWTGYAEYGPGRQGRLV